MLFSSRLPLSSLIELCRVGKHYLSSGLMLRDLFRQQAANGSLAVRPVAGRIAAELERGGGLEDALKRERKVFPPLLVALTRVGEQTGMLPEVFGELEKYYTRQQQLQRQFLVQITWPLIQFFGAIFVIAGLIFVLGIIPTAYDLTGKRYDPLGIGLRGPDGATTFLGIVFGTMLAVLGLYWLATRVLRQRAAFHALCLNLPVIGPCLRALALSRFCLALRLTTETAMPIGRALRLSMRATGNAAFEARAERAVSAVKAGDDLTFALGRTGMFPEDFLRILHTAEESGRLDDVLRQQGEHYDEESSRRLATLTGLASYGVWLFVGAIIIFAIFRIYGSYIALLNQF
jgi:type II secretory pathway component PulF